MCDTRICVACSAHGAGTEAGDECPPCCSHSLPHFLRYCGVSMNCSTRAKRAAAELTCPGGAGA